MLVKEQILCKLMFYTYISNFMQIGLLVDELLPFKEIQDGRHNYSFSQLAPQQLTKVIYSKNKKILSALLKHFEKKSSKSDYF